MNAIGVCRTNPNPSVLSSCDQNTKKTSPTIFDQNYSQKSCRKLDNCSNFSHNYKNSENYLNNTQWSFHPSIRHDRSYNSATSYSKSLEKVVKRYQKVLVFINKVLCR